MKGKNNNQRITFVKSKEEKEKELRYEYIEFIFTVFGLLFGIILFGYGIYMYSSGYHELDLAQNMKYIHAELDIELIDLHSDNNVYSYSEMFVMGFNKMNEGFVLTLLGLYFFMIGLMGFIHSIARLREIQKFLIRNSISIKL